MKKTLMAMGLLGTAAAVTTPAEAASVSRAPFGQMPDGAAVEAITLTNASGMQARIISYGAALQSLLVPDRHEELADVTLGYPTMAGYLAKGEFFGATVGRVANRIAGGKFTLDGKVYQTPLNDGPNALHGGSKGFDKVNWKVVEVKDGPTASVTLRYVSPHLDQGYPGQLTVTATYTLDEQNVLGVDYRATTDRPTVINLSNHAYWNLAGEGSPEGAMGHILTIPAEHFTPVNATLIPTGEFRPVAGTIFDFRRPTRIGKRVRTSEEQILFGKGYDHNWVVARDLSREPRLLARVEEPKSGRVMHVFSNQPGIQFYSGNFLDGTIVGKSGRLYRQGDAIVLEPQMFPDTPNQPAFGSVRLNPGQTYRNTIQFRFSTVGR
ncbi:aldose epimerase family protein [Sphingosinicella sp. BN140058]|uniref:aldose epimerase family protein n=1 Tax=Sphingosinicella sp. BN140058 TaxID=1892855 RepID=UPI0010105EAD|nr:aldose epimerase family protein [Sphingosinicella sp. BN140058]QAY75336.1 galactose mutarotase [Sphingosinicella sp. BN140058]